MNRKYDFAVGQVLVDTTLGCEWIVKEKVPDGVKLQLRSRSGPFIVATPETCSLEFRVKEIGATIWNRDHTVAGTVFSKHRRWCGACQTVTPCYSVRWPDGRLTRPCVAGIEMLESGDYHIM